MTVTIRVYAGDVIDLSKGAEENHVDKTPGWKIVEQQAVCKHKMCFVYHTYGAYAQVCVNCGLLDIDDGSPLG